MHEQPDLKWLPIEPTPEEVEWAKRMQAMRQNICQAFALPPEMLAELADRDEHEQAVLPAIEPEGGSMFEEIASTGSSVTIALNRFRFRGQIYMVVTSDITQLKHIQRGYDAEVGYQGILGNFETMLFVGEQENSIFPDNPFPALPGHPKLGYFVRYDTEDAARDGHQAFLTTLKRLLQGETVLHAPTVTAESER